MNDKFERKKKRNRTLIELVVASMFNSSTTSHWCEENILFICYVLNRVFKSKNKTSPYEIVKKRQSNLSYFQTWGGLAYVRIPDPERVKLASRAYEWEFIGYAVKNKAYRFYDLNAKVIIKSNEVDFYENKSPFKLRNSGGSKPSQVTVK